MIWDNAMEATGRIYHQVSLPVPIFIGVMIIWSLFTLDILSTSIILEAGGVEINRLMVFIVQYPWLHILVKMAVLLLIAVVASACNKVINNSGMCLISAIIALYVIVLTNNTSELSYLFVG